MSFAGDDFEGRAAFLEALRRAMSVSAACRKADVTRTEVFERRERTDTFKAEWDDALQQGADFLADEARDIAIGTEDNVTSTTDDGNRGVRKTYDGALLRFLLKAAKPDMFGAHPRAGRQNANEPIWMDPDPPRSDRGSER